MRKFIRHESGNFNLQRIQDNISQKLNGLIPDSPIINGRLIKDIELVQNDSKVVDHGLGRSLSGWLIARVNKNANIWDTAADSRTLTLTTGASGVIITIWVF